MRRYLLPLLTRPVLPRLPCLPVAEHRAVLEACLEKVEAVTNSEGDRWTFAPVRLGLAVPGVAALHWWWFGDSLRTAGAVVLGALLVWAHGLAAGRLMQPYLDGELRDRGLCTGCGYDLRGVATVCPECGRKADWPDWS